MNERPNVAPGWYPRADMPGTQGYWDGAKWSDQVAPLPVAAPTGLPDSPGVSSGIETLGWICAILLPIVGFVIGIVMISKGQGRGAGMMILAIAAFYFAYQAIASNSTGY